MGLYLKEILMFKVVVIKGLYSSLIDERKCHESLDPEYKQGRMGTYQRLDIF